VGAFIIAADVGFLGLLWLYITTITSILHDTFFFIKSLLSFLNLARLRRDIRERGRDLQGAMAQYNRFVKPAFEQHILPTMQYADLVVPRGALLADHIIASV
jgi:uridine kinase